ncbi:MAG: lanthanide-dependent methanol dehydrogenase [Acidobacteriaceae bacterium]|nr:lanthanide-dependent methanol dehydrogenase [Acidobacteriaceae bacterium]
MDQATTKDYENTRYSRLDQINASNVGSLKLAWTCNTGVAHGQEAVPIVANNTMFVVAPCQNKLCDLDLCKPGAPLQWSYNPSPIACCEGRPVHNEVFVGDSGGEIRCARMARSARHERRQGAVAGLQCRPGQRYAHWRSVQRPMSR